MTSTFYITELTLTLAGVLEDFNLPVRSSLDNDLEIMRLIAAFEKLNHGLMNVVKVLKEEKP